MTESPDFEIRISYPSINRVLDDIEKQILAPLSCLREFGTEWLLEFDLPLVNRKDLKVSLDDEIITVEAKLKETYIDTNLEYKNEFKYFKKSIKLPGKINQKKIQANFKNGRLTIKIPKVRTGYKIKID